MNLPSCFLFAVLLGPIAAASSARSSEGAPPAVSALVAQARNGQTYLVWSKVAEATATYRVYRAGTPFTSTGQLSPANFLGTATADSSFNVRLSQIRGTNFFFRTTSAGPDLTSTQGLYVHTTVTDGPAYYAVTAVTGGGEQLVIVSGQNTTANPVAETVAPPEPVLQRTFTINARPVEVYVHWASPLGTPFYPAMSNQGSVPHHFALVRRGVSATHSLLVRPHARMSNFLAVTAPTNDAEQWVLALDDWMPNAIQNTFWYGYHEGFDLSTGQPEPTAGVVHDYTARRVRWEFDWVMRTHPIDPNRIYMMGHSMGGIGSIFLSLTMPGRVAAIWTTSPKFDFSFLNDPNPANIWNLGSNERENSADLMWGTVEANLPASEGLPVYDRLNAGTLALLSRRQDAPVIIAFAGKNDPVVGWAEKLGFYQALQASRQGGLMFFDRGVHNRTGGEWVPQQNSNVLNRYRLDQSFPAFSASSADGDPGDGQATSGDAFGTINGNLDWDASSIVDTASQWRIRLLTVPLTATTGPVPAPASATVDVTPRRLQAFDRTPGRAARYEVRDAGDVILAQGLVVADPDGLYTVLGVPLTPAGTTLSLNLAEQTSPTVTAVAGGLQLTWPTTPGVRYQLEWSPELTQWSALGAALLASGSSLSVTDDGSLTGSSPTVSSQRFYRLRLSE